MPQLFCQPPPCQIIFLCYTKDAVALRSLLQEVAAFFFVLFGDIIKYRNNKK